MEWLVVVLVAFVVCAFLYVNMNDSNQQMQTQTDLENVTLLRQDIPRYTFVELYQRFPFDCADRKYHEIKNLERLYSSAVHQFLYFWNESIQHQSSYAPEMLTHMDKIEDHLNQLYDIMIQYCHVESDGMQRFETYSESVREWFGDIRRRNQGARKGLM